MFHFNESQNQSVVEEQVGPLRPEDEKALTELLFQMIQWELHVEKEKCALVEFGDFNLVDGY